MSNKQVEMSPIEDVVAAIARGEMIVMVDDEDRENEGDLIMAAQFATPEKCATLLALSLHHCLANVATTYDSPSWWTTTLRAIARRSPFQLTLWKARLREFQQQTAQQHCAD